MATALNIIERSFLDLRLIQGGGTVPAQRASDALIYLNDLIQSLDNEGLTIYQNTVDTHTMNGATSYTMGAAATIATTRPIEITSLYYTLSSVDTPITIITKEQYEAIPVKTTTGNPDRAYINYGYPNATIYLYPVPASGTLNISSNKPLTELATLSTVLALPPGYERMLRLNLDVELMPVYQKQDNLLIAQAAKSKSDIKRQNAANRKVVVGLGLPCGSPPYGNILNGP